MTVLNCYLITPTRQKFYKEQLRLLQWYVNQVYHVLQSIK